MSHTFHSHRVSVCDLPLGVLSYTLVLATVSLRDITEAQAAVKHVFSGTRLRQLAVLPQPRHFGSWTVERKEGEEEVQQRKGTKTGETEYCLKVRRRGRERDMQGEKRRNAYK